MLEIHSECATASSLTEANLALLDAQSSGHGSSDTSTISVAGASWSEDTSATEDSTLIAVMLRVSEIYCDRKLGKPPALELLLDEIMVQRDGPVTPNSKWIVAVQGETQEMLECEAIHILDSVIAIKPEILGGEKHVYRGQDHQWHSHALPSPPIADKTVAKKIGKLKQARPDICYGYKLSVLNKKQEIAMMTLGKNAFVAEPHIKPIFPFLVTQWKAHRGSILEARKQVQRDGATAVNAMSNFYEQLGYKASAADTAIFSFCVTESLVELRVHWKRIDSTTEEVTWEADLLETAMLSKENEVFQMRGRTQRIQKWALGPRLDTILKALDLKASGSAYTRHARSTSTLTDNGDQRKKRHKTDTANQ